MTFALLDFHVIAEPLTEPFGRKCDVGIHISAAVVNGQRISVGLGGIGLREIVGFLDLVSGMHKP